MGGWGGLTNSRIDELAKLGTVFFYFVLTSVKRVGGWAGDLLTLRALHGFSGFFPFFVKVCFCFFIEKSIAFIKNRLVDHFFCKSSSKFDFWISKY